MFPGVKLGGFADGYIKWLFWFSVVVNLLMLATPLYMLQIYDRVLSSGSVPTLLYLTLIVLFVLGMGGFADFSRQLIAQKLAARYTAETSDHLLKALASPAPGKQSGSKALREFALVRNFMTSRTFIGLFDLPFTPFFLLFMFLLNVWLGLIVLAGLCLMVGLGFLNKKATAPDQAKSRKAESDAMGYASASLARSEDIRAMGMLPAFQHRWGLKLLQSLNSLDNAGWHSSAFSSGSKMLRKALQVVVIGTGAFLVLAGDMSAGMIFAASMITSRALAPVDRLIGGWDSIVRARSAYNSVSAIVDGNAAPDERLNLPAPKGHLTIEGIGFKPRRDRRAIIENVSFAVKPGELAVVTGKSGAGKSTLARMLCGAIAPTAGTVRLDGTEQAHWKDQQWGEAIGYLAQEYDLIPATVAENIARLSYGFDEEKLLSASRKAGVHELVSSFPDGYNTRLGEGSFRLSGGEKQRIALARALYGSPKLLILDEPDANLDREGMKRLVRALEEAKSNGTAIIAVSHRSRLISRADIEIAIENGTATVTRKAAKPASSSSRSSSSSRRKTAAEDAPTPDTATKPAPEIVGYNPARAADELDKKFQELRKRSAKPVDLAQYRKRELAG
ncbi:MAG: type I secretion system permease/ATPase [Rhizobiaceae bacterium]